MSLASNFTLNVDRGRDGPFPTKAAKQVNVAATPFKVDGVKLKKWDDTDWRLPPAKYLSGVYKMLSLKQKEWLWQNSKANGEDIPP